MLQLDPMNTGHDERRAETGLARRQHIEGAAPCVRVDRDAADRQAPCQAGPGAGVYAGRRDEGLRSARPVATRCGGLVRGMCSRARCEAPIWRRIALDWRGGQRSRLARFYSRKARYPTRVTAAQSVPSDAGNSNTLAATAPRRSPQFSNAPSGPGTNLGNRRYSASTLASQHQEGILGRGVLLWLLGVPIPIIILIALLYH